jgi:hypothetical protein
MNVYQYIVCEDPDDYAAGIFCDAGTSAKEAKALAQEQNACVIELTFSFEDSELIEDFRGESA